MNCTNRAANKDDLNFIMSTWFKSYKQHQSLPSELFDDAYNLIIKSILDSAKVVISCNHEDESLIYSYIVFNKYKEFTIVHYVYTKAIYRKLGLAQNLLKNATGVDPIIYTFKTKNNLFKQNAYFIPDFKLLKENHGTN